MKEVCFLAGCFCHNLWSTIHTKLIIEVSCRTNISSNAESPIWYTFVVDLAVQKFFFRVFNLYITAGCCLGSSESSSVQQFMDWWLYPPVSKLLYKLWLIYCTDSIWDFSFGFWFRYNNVNINVAVQTDNGLYVPVVRVSGCLLWHLNNFLLWFY